MASQDQLEYVIKVVDEATANLNKISGEVEKLTGKMDKAGAASASSSMSFGKMAGAIGVATTAVALMQQTVQFLGNEFEDSIKAVNKYTNAMVGLSSVAGAFGENQSKARESAVDLAKDGLMPVTDAAAGLKNLLGTGFNMQESINLMKAFKDSAAFNRQGTLDFGEAIVGATQGIKNQNSIMVDNVGITKNLSIILEEAGYSQQDLMRVQTDASVRQALYNGLVREGEVFQGDAARAAETLAGSQSTLNTATTMLHVSIGQMLAPAMILFNTSMTDAANTANGSLQPVMTNIAKWFVVATEVVLTAASAIKNAFLIIGKAAIDVGNGLAALSRFDFGAVKDNFGKLVDDVKGGVEQYGKESAKILQNGQKVLNKLAVDGVKGFSDVARNAIDGIGGVVDKGGEKIAKQLETLAKKMEDINRNIAKEMTDFGRKISDATNSFTEKIKDLVIKHRDAIRDLRQEIAELTQDFADSGKDRLSDHDKRVNEIKKKFEEETKNLKDNLKRRMADTHGSDQQLTKYMEAQLLEKEKKRDEDLKNENDAFKEEEDKAKVQYDKQKSALEAKLNVELEVERKHADEFAKFKDAVVEDDITRAQNAFSREMEQMKYQHDQRMVELQRELEEAQAMKNKIMGTNTNTTGGGYKSTGATFSQTATKPNTAVYGPPSPAKSTLASALPLGNTITINNNIKNSTDMSAALKNIGWYIK